MTAIEIVVSKHMERAFSVHDAVLTRHGLVLKGFHNSLKAESTNINIKICFVQWSNLGLSDGNLNFTCMQAPAGLGMLSLGENYDLYDSS